MKLIVVMLAGAASTAAATGTTGSAAAYPVCAVCSSSCGPAAASTAAAKTVIVAISCSFACLTAYSVNRRSTVYSADAHTACNENMAAICPRKTVLTIATAIALEACVIHSGEACRNRSTFAATAAGSSNCCCGPAAASASSAAGAGQITSKPVIIDIIAAGAAVSAVSALSCFAARGSDSTFTYQIQRGIRRDENARAGADTTLRNEVVISRRRTIVIAIAAVSAI